MTPTDAHGLLNGTRSRIWKQMKVMFVAYRHDPRDPDRASGAAHQFYQAMQAQGIVLKVIGPFTENPPLLPERILGRIYRLHPTKRYIKYNFTNSWRAAHALNRADGVWRPDVIFTMSPAPLAFYKGETPCVFRTDTTFMGMHQQGTEFLGHDPVALRLMVWMERRAFAKCERVITQSAWSEDVLTQVYGLSSEKVIHFANPAALPANAVPASLDAKELKKLDYPIRLLFVGRDARRKGLDIALQVVESLNAQAIPSTLTVCGLEGDDGAHHRFVGRFKKSDPSQLRSYTELYRHAHLLLHPARFDASPIVTSEAAAFGTPTITNGAGGLATSVKDGESGIVLPMGSSAEAYVESIKSLIAEPEGYYELCRRTRMRYRRELNWTVAGEKFVSILREVAATRATNDAGFATR